jgi:hypothetical protein
MRAIGSTVSAPAVHELHDRLIEIRRALEDLGAVTTELAAVRGRTEARRILTDLPRRDPRAEVRREAGPSAVQRAVPRGVDFSHHFGAFTDSPSR